MTMSASAPATVPIGPFELAEAPRDLGIDAFQASGPIWYPALVPGGVHESLMAAGIIADPNYDLNEQSIGWIEDRDWWYRTTFPRGEELAPGERWRLVFHGLDTVVTIWLNGEQLGHHENMFRPAEFDVTHALLEQNELLLRFVPPLAGLVEASSVREMHKRMKGLLSLATDGFGDLELPENPDFMTLLATATAAGAAQPDDGSELAMPGLPPVVGLSSGRRKATFSWGWDFGPRIPSIGVWRPVELLREQPATIVGHHVGVAELHGTTARVAVRVQTRGAVEGLTARITLTAPSGAATRHEFPFDGDTAAATLAIDHAELWWTHDLGAANLYDVLIETVRDGVTAASLTDRIGLRTIELDQQPAEAGRLFRFVLNGTPVFARGASWLPPTMLVGSVDLSRYRELIALAREGNMNMIRVWGGGVYEHDEFYRQTDEQGVLVWQDFMFACTDYPSADPVLQAEVRAEAAHQVRRLRNRASLALWCGNNEVQMLHGYAFQGYEEGGSWGWDFFNRILPEAVQREDPFVPYWRGSPYGESELEGFAAVNGMLDGDRHNWDVWHGGSGMGDQFASRGEAMHPRRYAEDTGRFISEFGIHASPELSTLKRWIPDGALEIHSPSFDAHNKDHPKDKHDPLLEIVTGLPQTLEQYVEYTMVSQGEGLKFGIEHFRRRQPQCSGTLIWQLNDVWPGFSWSVIDFDLVPKAGYYYAARAFEPVLASFKPVPDGAELWVSNSTPDPIETTARVSYVGGDGRTTTSEEVDVVLAGGESRPFWSGPIAAGGILWVDGAGLRSNRYFAGEVKDIDFARHSLSHDVATTGVGTAEVTIRSTGYNYLTHIPSPHPGTHFSDNYFDLRDGETATVTVTGLPVDFDPAELVVATFVGASE
jgi:beta-mannosidase